MIPENRFSRSDANSFRPGIGLFRVGCRQRVRHRRQGSESCVTGSEEARGAIPARLFYCPKQLCLTRLGLSLAVTAELGTILDGKTLIHATKALNEGMLLALGFTTRGAEALQKKVPKARVVKAFNTVFAQYIDSGRLHDQALTTFVAGDDAQAKTMPWVWPGTSGSMQLTPGH